MPFNQKSFRFQNRMFQRLSFIVLSVFLCLKFAHSATNTKNTLALHKSTIVILLDPASEIQKHKDDPDYNEFSSDFAVYATRLEKAMKSISKVKIQWSSAKNISFPGTNYKPIERTKLETGWGYVFYKRGKKPIVLSGVNEDLRLVCTASKLYDVEFKDYDCDEIKLPDF